MDNKDIVRIGYCSIVGRRKDNEDRVYIDIDDREAFFGVYDGHGGSDTSKMLHSNTRRTFDRNMEHMSVPLALSKTYIDMDRIAGIRNHFNVGSTALNCYIRKEGMKTMIYTANVGDSRAVLIRKGRVERLSTDHNVDNETERKRMDSLGARIEGGYVEGVINMTRAIGDFDMKRYVIPIASVDSRELIKGDYVIMASDGLYDVVEDEELISMVGLSSPMINTREIVREAYRRQSTDNISVIVISM